MTHSGSFSFSYGKLVRGLKRQGTLKPDMSRSKTSALFFQPKNLRESAQSALSICRVRRWKSSNCICRMRDKENCFSIPGESHGQNLLSAIASIGFLRLWAKDYSV